MQIAQFLSENDVVPARSIDRACSIASETGDALGNVLERLGLISGVELAKAYVDVLGASRFNPDDAIQHAPSAENVPISFMKANRVVPYIQASGSIALAMSNPEDDFALRAVEYAMSAKAIRVVATNREIDDLLERVDSTDGGGDQRDVSAQFGDEADRLRDLASEAPVIRLVQRLVTQAIELKASDIHIEPMEDRLSVRYRVDGMLKEVETFPQSFKAAVVSRIKIMAQLNIAERRLPQDGRIQLTINGRETDFRIATSPTLHGESVVLRILDRRDVALDFSVLGFEPKALSTMRKALSQPHGIVLVTGPTGSGKTTTLYAALTELNTPSRKILTAEDPIEYTLERVNQVQVKPQIGHDFAHALRSFLRQDPDVIMVGEIRDAETARVGIQAALTGHLLLSTLHTNSAAGAVTRLLDMGIEDYLLASTLTLVVGQRLVRRLCAQCREAYPASDALLQRFKVDTSTIESPLLYRPVGCRHCNGTGYSGRVAITEMLEVTEAIQKLILAKADTATIERAAVAGGMQTMNQVGIHKALEGLTSVDEVLRVTQNL